jgi:biopolymer transport protein TolR
MSHGGGSDDRFMSDINVTPFVDVMLVLLIIFMVTAPMMMQGVDVDLPEATSEPLSAQEEALIVTVNKDGQVFISDYEVAVDSLGEKLLKVLEGRESREVFLNADKTVPYGIVVRVMSEIKAAGIESLGMVTEPEGQEVAVSSTEKTETAQ